MSGVLPLNNPPTPCCAACAPYTVTAPATAAAQPKPAETIQPPTAAAAGNAEITAGSIYL
jgi:hypothetical protein